MELLYTKLLYSVPCISRQFATEKNIPPVFNFLLSPNFSRRHLPPPVNGENAPDQLSMCLLDNRE